MGSLLRTTRVKLRKAKFDSQSPSPRVSGVEVNHGISFRETDAQEPGSRPEGPGRGQGQGASAPGADAPARRVAGSGPGGRAVVAEPTRREPGADPARGGDG